MGRHRLPDSRRRSQRIGIRLSPDDFLKLEAHKPPAESMSGHIRKAALRRRRPEPTPEVHRILLAMLNSYGQRINDQAHAAHLGATVTLTARELGELAALLRRMLQDLRG